MGYFIPAFLALIVKIKVYNNHQLHEQILFNMDGVGFSKVGLRHDHNGLMAPLNYPAYKDFDNLPHGFFGFRHELPHHIVYNTKELIFPRVDSDGEMYVNRILVGNSVGTLELICKTSKLTRAYPTDLFGIPVNGINIILL